MNLSTENEKEIFNFIKQQNCCLRCCFRFIGWRTVECYQDPRKFAKRLGFTTEENDLSADEMPCVSCLGILQNKTEESIQKIQHEVEKQNYDCETFTCALTVPVSVRLRERLLHIHCASKLNLSENILSNLKFKTQNIKDVWKWIVIPKLEQAIKKQADLTTPSAFLIEIFFTYKYDEDECDALSCIHKPASNPRAKKRRYNDTRFSRKSMEALMFEITDEQFLQCIDISSIKRTTGISIENVFCSHAGIFIGGRYTKLSRKLSQTPWLTNGEKKMETSVQDILCNPIAEAVRAQSIKFLSSGREDVDVRNIYSGRPFAVELIDPRITNITKQLLYNLVNEVNHSSKQVQITSSLKVLSRHDLKLLKEGENVKTKFYRALCVCRNAPNDLSCLEQLNGLKRVKIVQRTPVRVLHRRSLNPRTRVIYEMRARWAKPDELEKLLQTATEDVHSFFVFDVKAQAGTYVKEFVHGDFGRTKPSLRDLLNMDVDIVALDVTGINLNWP